MPDTYTLCFKNFRSLEEATIEVAPLTVVYGPNGSGKSSLIYGLLTLRNFLTNPNQNVPSLFAYPSIALGGLHEVVHRHSTGKSIALSIGISNPREISSKFTLTLNETGGVVESFDESSVGEDRRVVEWPRSLTMELAVPYQGNQGMSDRFTLNGHRPGQSTGEDTDPSPIPGILELWYNTSRPTDSGCCVLL